MKRSALVCVSLVAAASLLATTGHAQEVYRKPNFFEKLFGIKPKKRRVIERDVWWEDDGNVRILRQKKQRKPKVARAADSANKSKKKIAAVTAVASVDPEVAEGFGMGNLTYTLPPLVVVSDRDIGRFVPSDSAGDPIRLVLSDRKSDIKATAAIRTAVLAHYKAGGFAAQWMKDGKLTERGQHLLSHLARAEDEGLDPNRYLPAVLTDFANADQQVAGSTLAAAQLDVGLTVAAITFAQHISGGAFEPERLSQYHDLKPETVNASVALKVLAHTPFPVEYLKSLAPRHKAYQALKAELAKIDHNAPTVPAFPAGPRVKVGQKDARIIQLREMLAKEGLIQPVEVTDKNRAKLEFLDKPLSKVLRAYQKSRGIKETGLLDDATVSVLGGAPVVGNRSLIAINMERLRWLPKDLGRRHVFVNQAAQQLALVEDGKTLWSTNVVVGKPMTQTNVFSDTFDNIVVNPTWTMPQGIFLRDYLGKLRSNASYVDKKGYKVYDKNGKVIRSSAINWKSVGTASPYRIMQPAGASNALGSLKFNFPNRHAIYLHDTPQKELFSNPVRTFSNGCVRVENPAELAQKLLGFDANKLETMIEAGATKAVKVDIPTKVHLYYFTAWPDENGQIAYFGDSYERDKTLLAAMGSTQKTFARQREQQLVESRKSLSSLQVE